ncbi:hypothetical protein PJP10_31665, partial [Mycobacterium kansasii]
ITFNIKNYYTTKLQNALFLNNVKGIKGPEPKENYSPLREPTKTLQKDMLPTPLTKSSFLYHANSFKECAWEPA